MISNNSNVCLGIIDCSLYTRRIALKDAYHKKRVDLLAHILVEFNCLETLAKTFINPPRQNQFIRENFSNNTPVRQIAITNEQKTLHSMELALKILSGINNLVPDQLEYTELINQL